MTMIKLPDHIQAIAIESLILALSLRIQGTVVEIDACNLQPTSRASRLAAEAAVCVLLAHEIGQEVGR
jgi:hypothetical protein